MNNYIFTDILLNISCFDTNLDKVIGKDISKQLYRKSAIVDENAYRKQWLVEGMLHRVDGPAVKKVNGDMHWYQYGKLHRLDGPAIEWFCGSRFWYQNDKLHRDDGPAAEYISGSRFWYQHGKLHRVDGPAVEYYNGVKDWYQNDVKFIPTEEALLE